MAPDPKNHQTIVGRGVASNPSNRFEQVQVDFDPLDDDFEPQDLKTQTQYFRDNSRSLITYNDSPDIGLSASVNPYRGCSHGCVYCLSGDTPILMADGTIKLLRDVVVGDEVYGTVRQGHYRRYRASKVLAHWKTQKRAYRVRLEDGTELITSGDHRFLTERGWKYVSNLEVGQRPHLTINNKLIGIGAFSESVQKDSEYQKAYLSGLIVGDDLLASYFYDRPGRIHGNQHQFRLALADFEALARAEDYLSGFGIRVQNFVFQKASTNRREMRAIRTHALEQITVIQALVRWPTAPSREWYGGFLAGIFDAEGSFSQTVFCISNTDGGIIAQIVLGLEHFGFKYVLEHTKLHQQKPVMVIRLVGGLVEQMRFFHITDPAIMRKRTIAGQAVKSSVKLKVQEITPLGVLQEMYDISTETEDFIANGVVSHNCYARPTHEYLGFSAGLDFETKIMVKFAAPQLLRKEMSAKKWKPQTVMFSGVTDIYQPAERQFELTRRCLEVFLDFRNPVALITKNYLVTRDLDLLQELAQFDCVSVGISITTLDEELRRLMEPRTSAPSRRLKAVEMLAKAGIPVGVMTAPIIPGLTDHEIPRLVQAAADAGAGWVGFNIVHLPYGVKELFVEWLERHYPQRKSKVIGRIKALRGGGLNDPRFGYRMSGEGIFAEQIAQLHKAACKKAGLPKPGRKLSIEHFRVPGRAVQAALLSNKTTASGRATRRALGDARWKGVRGRA